MELLEGALDSVGLMRGPSAPISRAFVGAGITAAALYYFKPLAFFDPQTGQPRPWQVTTKGETSVMPTNTPWWMVSLGVGMFLGLFI